MTRPYKRRRILVDTFQYRFLAVNLIHLFTIFVIFLVTLFVPLAIELDRLMLTLAKKERMLSELLSLHMLVWPPILGTLVLLSIHSVFLSHRVAGPLNQFRRLFKAIAEGNLCVRAKVRKHDYLAKEADSMNEMITTLRMRVQGIEEQYGKVRDALAEHKRAFDSGSVQDMNRNIKSLEEQMERLKMHLDQFRTAA
ncbi:MAG: methyl-accepting chemotaxis protein [Nitrospirota bacterium]|nr:methyl-accepting chemotaxis protein [Nitrospirota bacterium]